MYTHNCPHCGGTIEDTLDINCIYCDSPLNSSASEWIVYDMLTPKQYKRYLKNHKKTIQAKVSQVFIDKVYDAKAYALNNLLVMVYADKKVTFSKHEFLDSFTKQLGYKKEKIEAMIKMAEQQKLPIRMPADPKERQKIYDLMVKAANIDHSISPQEKKVLHDVQKIFGGLILFNNIRPLRKLLFNCVVPVSFVIDVVHGEFAVYATIGTQELGDCYQSVDKKHEIGF